MGNTTSPEHVLPRPGFDHRKAKSAEAARRRYKNTAALQVVLGVLCLAFAASSVARLAPGFLRRALIAMAVMMSIMIKVVIAASVTLRENLSAKWLRLHLFAHALSGVVGLIVSAISLGAYLKTAADDPANNGPNDADNNNNNNNLQVAAIALGFITVAISVVLCCWSLWLLRLGRRAG